MNSNELNKRVMTVMQYGIAPFVTKYLQQHPEYFADCVTGSGMICQYEIALSYQPESLTAVADINTPTIIDVRVGGSGSEIGHELIKFNGCAGMESRWWIKGDCHTVRTVENG